MSDHQVILRLAIPSPLRSEYDYLPPENVDPSRLTPGVRLQVPFGKQQVIAILLQLVSSTEIEQSKLRRANRLLDDRPVLPEPMMKLCRWASGYYHHPIGEVLNNALPVLLRKGESADRRTVKVLVLTDEGNQSDISQFKNAPRQRAIVEYLRSQQSPLASSEIQQLQMGGSALRSLLQKNLVTWESSSMESPSWCAQADLLNESPLQLNQQQQQVFDQLSKASQHTHLLQGITGSGKTEVYLQIIERFLRAGKQALVLVPEIGLTPQTVDRFKLRFKVPIKVLHSGLNDRERLDAWISASEGSAAIVIGTRSAIFTPLKNPGVIVVDEEHDSSFKQQDGFRYSARDLAVMRGFEEKIPVILGSATPSLESLHNAQTGRYEWLQLTVRAGGAAKPNYRVLDIRSRPLKEGFSQPIVKLMSEHLQRGNQVMVFINRRGFAPTLLCHQCGWMAKCHRCDARLTIHIHSNSLLCHHCSAQSTIHTSCPDCDSRQLTRLGLGTERIESALHKFFPDERIIRIDRDTTRGKKSMRSMLAEIQRGDACILVGTQMLAKGHHFPKLTLVAILDADAGLFSSDFRAVEKMGQLLLQVAGRTGRSELAGQAVIQTHFSDHPLLQALIQNGYLAFANNILQQRKATALPPYSHIVLLRAEAIKRHLPLQFLHEARKTAEDVISRQHIQHVDLLGPIPAAMEKKAGRFRAQLLFQATNRNKLQKFLGDCVPLLDKLSLARKVRWSIDVDPLDTI